MAGAAPRILDTLMDTRPPENVSLNHTREQHLAHHKALHRRSRSFHVADYGIVGGDITAAGQAALDDCAAAGGGVVELPDGNFTKTAAWQFNGNGITLRGMGRGVTQIRDLSGDCFTSQDTLTWWRFEDMSIRADAGHVFALAGCVQSTLRNLELWATAADKCLWFQDVSAGGTCIENAYENLRLTATPTHTVPAWYCVGSGNVNANTWRNLRCTYSGDYFFHLESVSVDSWLFDNAFRDINFEITNGGSLRLLGCQNTVLDNCHESDLHALGDITKDLLLLDAGAGGVQTWHTAIRSCGRRGGLLAAGVYDINIQGARHTLIDSWSAVPLNKASVQVSASARSTTKIVNSAALGGDVWIAPDGTRYRQTVDNAGVFVTTAL